MIDMNIVYELIAKARETGVAKRFNYFGLDYYAIDHYDHTSVRVLNPVRLAKYTATSLRGLFDD